MYTAQLVALTLVALTLNGLASMSILRCLFFATGTSWWWALSKDGHGTVRCVPDLLSEQDRCNQSTSSFSLNSRFSVAVLVYNLYESFNRPLKSSCHLLKALKEKVYRFQRPWGISLSFPCMGCVRRRCLFFRIIATLSQASTKTALACWSERRFHHWQSWKRSIRIRRHRSMHECLPFPTKSQKKGRFGRS